MASEIEKLKRRQKPISKPGKSHRIKAKPAKSKSEHSMAPTKETEEFRINNRSTFPVNLKSKDWEIKGEEIIDLVSDEWGKEIGRRVDSGRFWGISHLQPTTETREFEPFEYKIVKTVSIFHDKNGVMSTKKVDKYESYTVYSETPKTLITGNFCDLDMAILWIEGTLEGEK